MRTQSVRSKQTQPAGAEVVQPIRAKVARVLNPREIAISAGHDIGVSDGMIFDVISATEEDVLDPDTREVLGSVERRKVRVKVVDVKEKLSVARTYRKKVVNVGGTHELERIAKLLSPPRYVTEYETLTASKAAWDYLSGSERDVETGDPVVQVMYPDDDE